MLWTITVDYGLTSNEFFYQIGLTDFGNFGRIKLSSPLNLREILRIAAQVEQETSLEMRDLDLDKVVTTVYNQILAKRAMLEEYFSIEISEDGQLGGIPLLLKGYTPCMGKLPTFLLRLGPFVNWTDEQQCFKTFLTELASFYVPEQLAPRPSAETEEDDTTAKRRKEIWHVLEHILFPAFRSRIIATSGMLQGVVEVANLKGLYRVFERC